MNQLNKKKQISILKQSICRLSLPGGRQMAWRNHAHGGTGSDGIATSFLAMVPGDRRGKERSLRRDAVCVVPT